MDKLELRRLGKPVAIFLGIVCIILLALLIGVCCRRGWYFKLMIISLLASGLISLLIITLIFQIKDSSAGC